MSNPILGIPIESIDQNHPDMLYEETLDKYQDRHLTKLDPIRSNTFSISIELIQSSFFNDIPNSHQSIIEFRSEIPSNYISNLPKLSHCFIGVGSGRSIVAFHSDFPSWRSITFCTTFVLASLQLSSASHHVIV